MSVKKCYTVIIVGAEYSGKRELLHEIMSENEMKSEAVNIYMSFKGNSVYICLLEYKDLTERWLYCADMIILIDNDIEYTDKTKMMELTDIHSKNLHQIKMNIFERLDDMIINQQ